MADRKTPIAKAYVQVLPTTTGISGQLSGLFGKEGASAGSLFGGNLVGTIKGIMATAGIGAIIKESLLSGADLQQSLGGVETLFKDSTDLVIANAEQAYKTAGMSANEYMETVTGFSASLLQSLSGDTKAAADAADKALKDMSDNANKMGTDMELIQNAYQGFAKQNYTMLDNLKLGYGGTKTEMQRLLADAQKITGVKYDISNLADVYEAIHMIQESMGITGATADEAKKTFSGSFASMKAAASDLMAQIALGTDDLTPYFDNLTDTVFIFGRNLLPMVGNILSGLPTVIRGGFSAAIRGLNLAAENAPELLEQGVGLVREITGAVMENGPLLAEAAWNLAVAFGEEILAYDWLGSGGDLVLEFSGGLLEGAPDAVLAVGDILLDILQTILDAAPEVVECGVDLIGSLAAGLLENAPEVMLAVGGILAEVITMLADSLPELLASGIDLIGELATGLFENSPEVFSAIGTILGEMMASIVESLPEILDQGAELVSTLITGIFTGIPLLVEGAVDLIDSFCQEFADFDWLELGADIIDGICDGIYRGFQKIWEVAGELGQNALDGVAFALDIHSPSVRFRDEIGVHIPSGIAMGVEKNATVLDDAMEELSALTLDAYHVDLDTALDTGNVSLRRTLTMDHRFRSGGNESRGGKTVQVTIHVHAAEGMDVRALAREVARELAFEVEKAEVSVA